MEKLELTDTYRKFDNSIINDFRDKDQNTALMTAVLQHKLPYVLQFFEQACQRNEEGMTALMMAAQRGFKEAVVVLMQKEGRMQDQRGFSGLMYALLEQQWETATILLDLEANLTSADGMNARSLLIADELVPPFQIKTQLDQLEAVKPLHQDLVF